MKKYLLSALALPLLFACSSEDYLDQKATDNDQFAGIEKVDATFSMADSPSMRMDKGSWQPEEGDLWGFAWLGGGEATALTIDGNAWQNHNLIQKGDYFEPQTSIYVGNYYLYRPYDKTTVNIGKINFKSLEEQPLAEGYASTTDAWKNLAKTAINIGDKWTNVTGTGRTITGKTGTWDKAGIKQNYEINAAMFSNQTGLDLTYLNNNVKAPAAGMHFAGATDIDYTIAAGTKIGAADIYEATVQLEGAAKSFTYAPTTEPNAGDHDGAFWADQKNLGTSEGFTFTSGAVTLAPEDAENGISTDKEDNKAWFWFNSLPVTAGNGAATSTVDVTLTTSYGTVTVEKDYDAHTKYTVADCAYAGNVESGVMVWHPLADAADPSKDPAVWAIGSENTFINQYGNHKGKFALNVDFSKGVMNGMHIKNDTHLQKLLKYYIAAGKTETGVVLNLDADADGNFKISKISIALLQTINASSAKVLVQACSTDGNPKIIVTQDGQADLGLADKKEVPALDNVFAVPTDVYLSDCEWTWAGTHAGTNPGKEPLPVDADVKSLTNEGTLTVTATKFGLSIGGKDIKNAADAIMNITKVTTVHNPLTNLGKIEVGSESNKTAELRAYGVEIKNDATALDKRGVINNYGVVGVTDGTSGTFNNYGLIDMKDSKAITLLTTNEKGTKPFGTPFAAGTNMMGTVVLPDGNPTAIVSVNNEDANGFIKYTWPASETTYVTPVGNVKYNTIVVSGNIEFTATETEIQYIEFNGERTQVVNPGGLLTSLKGVIVNAGKSIIIEKGNQLKPSQGVFLGEGATVYNGGKFIYPVGATNNYFGTWSTDQIVKY